MSSSRGWGAGWPATHTMWCLPSRRRPGSPASATPKAQRSGPVDRSMLLGLPPRRRDATSQLLRPCQWQARGRPADCEAAAVTPGGARARRASLRRRPGLQARHIRSRSPRAAAGYRHARLGRFPGRRGSPSPRASSRQPAGSGHSRCMTSTTSSSRTTCTAAPWARRTRHSSTAPPGRRPRTPLPRASGADLEPNWLPAPDRFSLNLRAYGGQEPVRDGSWTPPMITTGSH